MKKFTHLLFGLVTAGILVFGFFQFAPDVTTNVGWNGRFTAAAETTKSPIYPQPNVGWNS